MNDEALREAAERVEQARASFGRLWQTSVARPTHTEEQRARAEARSLTDQAWIALQAAEAEYEALRGHMQAAPSA